MTVLHSGTSKKFSDNWGNAFGAAKSSKKAAAPKKKSAKVLMKKGTREKSSGQKRGEEGEVVGCDGSRRRREPIAGSRLRL